MKGLKTEEFIEKSKLIWGNRFDYSLVEYINNNTKVKIICPINGVFEQQPKRHLEGRESKNKRLENKQNFIERANKKFNFKFDYSLVEYKNNDDKVIIICPIHGQFEQCTDDHLNSKYACNDCKKDVSITNKVVKEKVIKKKLDKIKIDRKELFFKRCFEIHGDRYDYSLTEFKSSNDKVKIICREHGIFEQRASAHTSDQGCMECRLEKRRTGLDIFISRCFEIHGDKYDYSLVNKYVNSVTKVDIICKKHGVFKMRPEHHTNREQGCPVCKESIGERIINNYLEKKCLEFKREFKFKDCLDIKQLRFDFYIPKNNICIEYQGKQHYEPVGHFGGLDKFSEQLKRDKIKSEYCYNNNIHLIIIKYDDDIYGILDNYFLG
jgi:hypothetical protein